jgi:hypothetical protein
MSQPVAIENEFLSVKVYPNLGGKVASVVDKVDRYELMFNYPTEIPTESHYDIPYGDSWYAGWDECFPGIAPGPYPLKPYENIAVPDHGELWGLPTTAVPTRNGITTVWHGLRFGYRLTRKLFVEGPTLVAEYTLINLSPFPFRFVWAQHALLSMVSPLELRLPVGQAFRASHDADGRQIGSEFSWPNAPGEVDLSKPGDLPPMRGWKVFSTHTITDAATVTYPARRRTLSIAYSSDQTPAYWGIWLNTGGWASHRHLAVEPSTGRYDAIDKAVKDGSAATVEASGRREWRTVWTVGGL